MRIICNRNKFMPFPVVKKCANVTHVFDSAGNIRLPQVYKPIIILMYHLSFWAYVTEALVRQIPGLSVS